MLSPSLRQCKRKEQRIDREPFADQDSSIDGNNPANIHVLSTLERSGVTRHVPNPTGNGRCPPPSSWPH